MGIRRQARELAIQVLFSSDFNNDWNLDLAQSCSEFYCKDKTVMKFANLLITGVIKNKINLDSNITKASENWSISRMSRVDRSILRVCSYEIIFLNDVPVNVSINEAIEIAKKFGSEDSANFINGVIDRIARSHSVDLENVDSEPLDTELLKIA